MTSKFKDLGLNKFITNAMESMGWTEPTPIQIASIPEGIQGRDMFAQAQTGTGKTGAYAGIILERTKAGSKYPTTLILVPTRELANQVSGEIYKLSKYTGHKGIAVYGGASIDGQIKLLRRGADVIIGTPGRVKDMILRGELVLKNVTEFVLDEADRMLDMGFSEEIDFIVDQVPETRQTLLFSATMSEDIRKLALDGMDHPLEILVSKDELVSDLTRQYYINVPRGAKREILFKLLDQFGRPKTIVFCATKAMVDMLIEKMNDDFRVGCIHGDIPQIKREKVIKNFRKGSFDVLIATDVAARGLDIDDVECVVNYDMPNDPETYMHRIGRTGRAGRTGVAVSLITPNETWRLEAAEKEMGFQVERMDRPRGEKKEKKVTVVHVTSDKPAEMPDLMTVLELSIGKSDGYGKSSIADMVASTAHLSADEVGRVGLGSGKSFIEVAAYKAESTVAQLTQTKINGRKLQVKIAPRKSRYKDKSTAGL